MSSSSSGGAANAENACVEDGTLLCPLSLSSLTRAFFTDEVKTAALSVVAKIILAKPKAQELVIQTKRKVCVIRADCAALAWAETADYLSGGGANPAGLTQTEIAAYVSSLPPLVYSLELYSDRCFLVSPVPRCFALIPFRAAKCLSIW